MLFERLEKVRQQPRDVRQRFALFWSVVITATIILLWISVIFGRSYADRDTDTSVNETAGAPEVLPENLRSIFDNSNVFQNEAMYDSLPTSNSAEESVGEILDFGTTTNAEEFSPESSLLQDVDPGTSTATSSEE